MNCPRCGATDPTGRLGLCPRCLLQGDDAPAELGELELIDELGRGGMGSVYRARHKRLDRTVAVKLLPPELAERPEFAARFEREAKAMALLSHPNIVSVHDAGKADGQAYIVMEMVKGRPLSALLPLPPERAVAILRDVCRALEYAHGRGVVHRDVKPANILIGDDGAVKVSDFGIARLTAPDSKGWTVTRGGEALGTPHYMPPEALQGAAPDPRQDVYSLGVVLYETLTGRLPVGDFAPAPAPFDALVRRALAPDPAARPANAAAFRAELEKLPSGSTLPADERAWLHATALALTAATAVGLFAFLECVRPKVIAESDVRPLSIAPPERLPDGRLVSRARFETWPALAALVAAAVALAAWGALHRHWRRAGLARPAPDAPVAEARVVLWIGGAALALWGVRHFMEALQWKTAVPYVMIGGGAVEIAMLLYAWSAILQAWRVSRPVLREAGLWAGVVMALVPPVVELVTYVNRWKP